MGKKRGTEATGAGMREVGRPLKKAFGEVL